MVKESGTVKQALFDKQRTFLWLWSSYVFDNFLITELNYIGFNTVGCTEPSSFHSASTQLLKDRKSKRLPPNSKPQISPSKLHQSFQPNRLDTSRTIPTNSTCWSTPPRWAVTLEAWWNFVTNSTISTGIRYASMLSWGERRKEISTKYSSSTN